MEELLYSGQGLLVIIMTVIGVGGIALTLLVELVPVRRRYYRSGPIYRSRPAYRSPIARRAPPRSERPVIPPNPGRRAA